MFCTSFRPHFETQPQPAKPTPAVEAMEEINETLLSPRRQGRHFRSSSFDMVECTDVIEANDRLSTQRHRQQPKVVDLVNFWECDTTLAPKKQPVPPLQLNLLDISRNEAVAEPDDFLNTDRTAVTVPLSNSSTLTSPRSFCSESGRDDEVDLLQQRLKDAEEELRIQVAIKDDHMSEKDKRIAELELRCTEAEAVIATARGSRDDSGPLADTSRVAAAANDDACVTSDCPRGDHSKLQVQRHSQVHPFSTHFWMICTRQLKVAVSHIQVLQQMTRVS